MHGYNRNWTTRQMAQFDPWSPNKRTENKASSRRASNKCDANAFGDSVFRDESGKITAFRYSQDDTLYSFEYENDGNLSTINRSDGWMWRRVNSGDFIGWVVRNYFETWSVSEEESGAVFVDDDGVKATGEQSEKMSLPDRRAE